MEKICCARTPCLYLSPRRAWLARYCGVSLLQCTDENLFPHIGLKLECKGVLISFCALCQGFFVSRSCSAPKTVRHNRRPINNCELSGRTQPATLYCFVVVCSCLLYSQLAQADCSCFVPVHLSFRLMKYWFTSQRVTTIFVHSCLPVCHCTRSV